ncbi:MAG: site-specific integrase [Armatimonadetes bacterium]|nr:site-specific integrase [Armatimonadota bacterium]
MARIRLRRDKGTGAIFQLNDGRWRSEIAYRTPDGRRKVATFTRMKKGPVVAEHNRRVHSIENGTYGRRENAGTLDALVAEWLENEIRPNRAADTYRSYSELYENHIGPKLGKMRLDQITLLHVRELLRTRKSIGLSASTVDRIKATIRSAFSYAISNGVLVTNPASGLKASKGQRREVKYLEPGQAKALIEVGRSSSIAGPLLVALGTGMRLGEVLGLRWKDVDESQRYIRLNFQLKRGPGGFRLDRLKTESSRRTLEINDTVASALQAAKTLQVQSNAVARKLDLVFVGPEGGPMHQKYFNDQLKALCREIGVEPISAHSLRHTVATLLIANNIDLAKIQQQLGHSSITLTADTYGHLIRAGGRITAKALDDALRSGDVS